MNCKAKFQVTKVAEMGYDGKRSEIMKKVSDASTSPDRKSISFEKWESTGIPIREITMSAVYGGSAEDASFSTATPSGSIVFQLNNPDLAEEFKPGQTYYVNFTRA